MIAEISKLEEINKQLHDEEYLNMMIVEEAKRQLETKQFGLSSEDIVNDTKCQANINRKLMKAVQYVVDCIQIAKGYNSSDKYIEQVIEKLNECIVEE